MKLTTAFLAASLVANAALIAVFVSRAPVSPAADADFSSARPLAGSPDATRPDALHAALASGDIAALEAAGLSAATIRELTAGRAILRAAERIRAARAAQPVEDRWWRNRSFTPGTHELQLRNQRELSEALTAAVGDDLGLFSSRDASQLAFLPPEKRDALRRITQDYDEMMAKFSAGGVQLASDRERLKLLQAERERDIAALLTPEEREAYEMRTSRTGNSVRARYGDGIQSEEDFRKIYALQKAFDEQFNSQGVGRLTPEIIRQRDEAQRQLQEQIRGALGEEKFAAVRRASDSDLRTVDSLATRLNLPPTTTDQVAATRETLAAQSQRINADRSLTPEQRRAQITALGQRARADLTPLLGAEAADAYAQRSPWLNMLQNGMAYSTTPPAGSPASALGSGQRVHPVMPPDAAGPGAVRHSFGFVAPAGDSLQVDGAAPGLRVMTFSTSTADGAAAAGPASAPQRVIVAPGQTAPAAPPANRPKR